MNATCYEHAHHIEDIHYIVRSQIFLLFLGFREVVQNIDLEFAVKCVEVFCLLFIHRNIKRFSS